jgi:hypothetical protein
MKKTDEMPEELNLDYSKARSNRFAEKYKESEPVVVLLDPDVAEIFTSSEAVNKALRALIDTMRGVLETENSTEHAINDQKETYSP